MPGFPINIVYIKVISLSIIIFGKILFRVPLDRATLFSVVNTAVLVLMTLEWCHTEPDLTFLVSVRVRD